MSGSGEVPDMYAWPEREETLGAATLTLRRGWRENTFCRTARGPWTGHEIQRPPDELYAALVRWADPSPDARDRDGVVTVGELRERYGAA